MIKRIIKIIAVSVIGAVVIKFGFDIGHYGISLIEMGNVVEGYLYIILGVLGNLLGIAGPISCIVNPGEEL